MAANIYSRPDFDRLLIDHARISMIFYERNSAPETVQTAGQHDAILLGTPPYSGPTDVENVRNALAIGGAANLPVMLCSYPGRMGVSMGEVFLDMISRSPNICAIKESSAISTVCTCWHARIQTSRWLAVWMIRRLSFLHVVRAVGSVRAAIPCRTNMLPLIRPALSRAILTKGAAS